MSRSLVSHLAALGRKARSLFRHRAQKWLQIACTPKVRSALLYALGGYAVLVAGNLACGKNKVRLYTTELTVQPAFNPPGRGGLFGLDPHLNPDIRTPVLDLRPGSCDAVRVIVAGNGEGPGTAKVIPVWFTPPAVRPRYCNVRLLGAGVVNSGDPALQVPLSKLGKGKPALQAQSTRRLTLHGLPVDRSPPKNESQDPLAELLEPRARLFLEASELTLTGLVEHRADGQPVLQVELAFTDLSAITVDDRSVRFCWYARRFADAFVLSFFPDALKDAAQVAWRLCGFQKRP